LLRSNSRYLNHYENYFRNLNQLDDQKKEWLNWARKKADWYDPFIELNDEVMERIDRDKLEPISLKGWVVVTTVYIIDVFVNYRCLFCL